jgi:molybdopterin converting factor small subunit
MPTVFIPALMQDLTGGKQTVEVEGSSVRQVVDALGHAYPGVLQRILEDGEIKPSISVAVDGEVTTMGMLETVGENSEVHFIPAIAGG